jgi:Zn finger protein HypA/HybF involved in hydrogenase expression
MHEMSFAEQVLEVVAREAEAAVPGAKVARVKLRAGTLLALEPASLQFALEAISADTSLEGARFEYEETDGLGPELVVEEIELHEQDDSS